MNMPMNSVVISKSAQWQWLLTSVALACAMIVLSCVWDGGMNNTQVFLELRLPRVLAAFGGGGLLALAGLMLQALLRNPLAEPYMLGVASGASVSLLVGTVMGLSWWFLQGLTFLGALAVLLLMGWVLKRFSRLAGDISIVLLLGVVLSSLLNAVVSVLLLLMPERALRGALFWLMGDLAGAGHLYVAWVGVWLCLLMALPLARSMTALMRGSLLAHSVGVSVRRVRVQLLLLAGLATAIAVTEAGAIGFIGLVVPHFVKLFCAKRDFSMRSVMLLSVIWGGALLVLADVLARSIVAPMQLPVGVLTIALGAPFLAWQLVVRLHSGGHL